MRIQYITNVRIPTGRAQGYAIMKMCSEFAKAGAEVILSIPEKSHTDNLKDPFEYYGLENNFKINKIKSFDLLGSTLKFGRIFYWMDLLSFLFSSKSGVKLLPADIVYTRDFVTTLFFPKETFIVLELHDISSESFLFKKAIKKAKLFFVLNENLKSDLVSMGVKPENIFITPSGVDMSDFSQKETKEALRVKLSLPEDKKIVLYTGQFYSWKGVETLALTARLLPDTIFVFVGGAEPELSNFKNKYGNLPNIILRPFQERNIIGSYLRASDVLVLPNSGKYKISSRYTSPLKLFEYMASERPIVASDLPSVREILNEDNSVFAKADNPESFSVAIQKVLGDDVLAEKIASSAYTKVQDFTWGKRAKKILDTIQSWI